MAMTALLILVPVIITMALIGLLAFFAYRNFATRTKAVPAIVLGIVLLFGLIIYIGDFLNPKPGVFESYFANARAAGQRSAATATPTPEPLAPIDPNTPEPVDPSTLPSAILPDAPVATIVVDDPAPIVRPVKEPQECWPEPEDSTGFEVTAGMTINDYIKSIAQTKDNLWYINRALLKEITGSPLKTMVEGAEVVNTNPGYLVFEGQLPESLGTDTTDIFIIDVNGSDYFIFVQGTFRILKSDACQDRKARLAAIDKNCAGKWQNRESNIAAGLDKFTLICREDEAQQNGYVFNKANPYQQFTSVVLNELNVCNDLVSPLRTDFFGEQNGEYRNYSLGGPGCRSMGYGDFQENGTFLGGINIRLYPDAADNQYAKGTVVSYIFPANWTTNTIIDWLATNYKDVHVDDPLEVLK